MREKSQFLSWVQSEKVGKGLKRATQKIDKKGTVRYRTKKRKVG